jgi:hypothetical protein
MFSSAELDLVRAEELFTRLDQRRDAAAQRHNRGWCASRAGHVTTALEHFEAAERAFAALGLSIPEVPHDRATLLLDVGLVDEARELAEQAAAAYFNAGHRNGWAEAMLTSAQAALRAEDAAAAAEWADRAKQAFAE